MHDNNEFNSTCYGADVLISSETAHDSVGNVNGGTIDYSETVRNFGTSNLSLHKLISGDSRLFHKLVDDDGIDRFGRRCPTASVVQKQRKNATRCDNVGRVRRPIVIHRTFGQVMIVIRRAELAKTLVTMISSTTMIG